MKIFLLLLIVSSLLTSCMTQATPVPTTTLIPFTEMPTLTFTPQPTPTETSVPTEAGPKEGDTYTENRYTYIYTKLGETNTGEPVMENVRGVGTIIMYDNYFGDFFPFTIGIADNTQGEEFLRKLTYRNWTTADIPSSGVYNPPPITASFAIPFRGSYFANDTRQLTDKEKQLVIVDEMLGQGGPGHEQAKLKINISNGNEKEITIGTKTGIILTIMDPETLFKLGQDGALVSTWQVGDVTFYSEMYGVDEQGNMLCRMAFEGSLGNLTDDIFRIAIFSFPANLVDHQDQGRQGGEGPTDVAITIAHRSDDSSTEDGLMNLVIERVPPALP